jgi:hypothetical protein
VFDRECVTAERNGPDVLADERLPYAALAEADRVRGYAWDHLDPALPKFDKMPPM